MLQMDNVGAMLLSLLMQNAIFVGIATFFLHRRGLGLQQVGLRLPTTRQVGAGLAGGFLLFCGALVVESIATEALKLLLPHAMYAAWIRTSDETSAGGAFRRLHPPVAQIGFALIGALIAPVCEEIFFRAWIYTMLKGRGGVTFGVVGSGLIFGLAHLSPLAFCVLFPMGMLLAYVYERTGSLWISIMLHATNNALAFVALWLLPKWAG